MRSALILVSLLATGVAHGEPEPALARLEKSLPAGWSMLATDTVLVMRHDRPCYTTGAAAAATGPMITLELRYHLEPKWTAAQLAEARATNDRLAAELRAAHQKVAAIKSKHPSADEQARLDAYAKTEASVHARMIKLPWCTLGASSLFEGDDTYSQLSLPIDPPSALAEARAVVELVKRECTAT